MINRHYPSCLLAFFLLSIIATIEAIVGGDKAQPYEFPYQVALHIRDVGYNCGGGIIGDQIILTAAHCVLTHDGAFSHQQLMVVAGTNNLRRLYPPAVTVSVKKIYMPTENSLHVVIGSGDIAVLRLNHSLGLLRNHHLKWLQLARNKNEDFADKTVMMTGFGWTWSRIENGVESGGNNDSILRYGESVVFNQTLCQLHHPNVSVTDKELCAQMKQSNNPERPRGVCIGDSGGPLVYNGRTVIGIFSAGPAGCSEATTPAIYTRVSHYLTFIINAMNDRVTRYMRVHELF